MDIRGIKRTTIEAVVNEYVVGFKATRNRKLLILRWCDELTYVHPATEAL